MFERFTHEARHAIVAAQDEARLLNHNYIGTEHILLGLLADEQGVAARALADHGLTLVGARSRLEKLVPRGMSPLEPDPDALEAIGIDLEAVRRKVEEAFGPGALERRRPAAVGAPPSLFGVKLRRRALSGLRNECRRERRFGYVPFTPRAKKVMELSLRCAVRLRHRDIATEHILLALLDEGEGLAARIIADAGIDFAALRHSVIERVGRDAG